MHIASIELLVVWESRQTESVEIVCSRRPPAFTQDYQTEPQFRRNRFLSMPALT